MKWYNVAMEFWSPLDRDWEERHSQVKAKTKREAVSLVRKLYSKRVTLLYVEEIWQ